MPGSAKRGIVIHYIFSSMPQCCARNCKNRGVHIFPKEPTRRKCWENALRIKNFRANNTARLCAMHFKEDDYFGKSRYTDTEPLAKFLKKTAVPSVFQHYEKICQSSLFEDNKVAKQKARTEPTVSHINLNGQEEEICTTGEKVEPVENAHTDSEYLSKSIQVDHEYVYGSISRFKTDDKSILFYTGFETYKNFYFVYSTLSPMAHKIKYFGSNVTISTEDQFFLILMKLRQDKCNFELSRFFNVDETTVSNIFITWINFIYELWCQINIWPSKELIQDYIPTHFKEYNGINRGFTIQDMFPDKNRQLASKHEYIEIERIIGLTKTYKITESELDHSYIPLASKIFYVCFMCCNLRECIMKKDKTM